MYSVRKVWREWRSDKDGAAALEFGLFIPVLAIFITGIVELGFSLYQAGRVYDANEAGLIYASQNGWNASGISNAIVTATGFPGIAASPAPVQFCGCPAASGISAVSCTSTCSSGNAPSQYIQVNALLTRQSIVSFPGLGLPSTLSATGIIRTN